MLRVRRRIGDRLTWEARAISWGACKQLQHRRQTVWLTPAAESGGPWFQLMPRRYSATRRRFGGACSQRAMGGCHGRVGVTSGASVVALASMSAERRHVIGAIV